MADESWPEVDLWGEPGRAPADPRGRKRHKRRPEIAEKVAVLRACGKTVEDISSRVGVSEPTLRKYYLRELERGSELVKAALLESMWDQVKAGRIGAARFIREELAKGDEATFTKRASLASRPAAPLGKKEEQALAAQSAGQGSEWGDDLAPAPRLN